MSTGTVDMRKLMEESAGKMDAMGDKNIPTAAGVSHSRGIVTNDPAALLQVTSSAGVPQVQLPSTSLEKPPTPGA